MRHTLIVPFVCSLLFPVFPSSVWAVDIVTGFSPSGTAQTVILDALNEAKHTIDLAAYSFTSKPVSMALLAAQKRGVVLRVLADEKANSTQYTAVTFLANQGVPVRLNRRYSIMHHKFAVIDNQSVQTGSFNYSAAADKRNAENVIYLRNSPETAAAYAQEFNRLWAEGYQLDSRYPANKNEGNF